jgi:hypothetical protein
MVWIAIIAMMCATLAQHLGLTQEVSKVVSKIGKCPKCCSFWITLATMLYVKCDFIIAIALSISMAYLSYFFGFVLIGFQKLYSWLERKLSR